MVDIGVVSMRREASFGNPEPVLLLDLDPGRFRYSVWRNITIGVWADQATEEAARRIIALSRSMARNHAGGHSNVIFVLDGAPPPTPEANQIFAQIHDQKVSDLVCMGIVVEGSGFWASAIRSSITGVRMSSASGIRMGVSDNVNQLMEWLPAEHSKRTGVNVSASELRPVLVALRELAANDNGERPLMASQRSSSNPSSL
ncbi:MAG TPA: hypothetical protein VFZ61_05670 [Polyangiales bacterium]